MALAKTEKVVEDRLRIIDSVHKRTANIYAHLT